MRARRCRRGRSPRPYPGGVDAYIDPAYSHEVFAADLPEAQTRLMAAEQRPGSLASLGEPSGVPAWRTIPCWYAVAADDHAIPPAAERFMARRSGARTVVLHSSHVAMISHPDRITSWSSGRSGPARPSSPW